eukprot:g20310.t1
MSKKEKLCFESEGSAPLSAAAERDELLKVLSLINRSCPEAAGFLEPLGHFVPSSAVKEVSAWEAAAERVGKQAEVISELAAKHSQSVLDLQETNSDTNELLCGRRRWQMAGMLGTQKFRKFRKFRLALQAKVSKLTLRRQKAPGGNVFLKFVLLLGFLFSVHV